MAKVAIFMADGTEEVEAITPADILRRAQIDCDIISVMPSKTITASRGVMITTDKQLDEIDFDDYDMLVLPGGIKGTENLRGTAKLTDAVVRFNSEGKAIAAICAAPSIFAGLGLLKGKHATSNPGVWDIMTANGADLDKETKVVTCGNIITSQAMGTSVPFGLAIVEYFQGKEAAEVMKGKILF
ncbi:MAG: DJ-1/PfpI family protein [Clostridiales bacterium]|nr:DJ-1/PfpI family protein [Clostridiales bacterium]